MINEASGTPSSQHERPFGMVAFAVQITGEERKWLQTILTILDDEPPYEELPEAFRRAVQATAERPLGVLHSFSKQADRPNVTIWPWQPEPGSGRWIVDISSLGVDVGALAMLVAVVTPSALKSSFGFPYKPLHDRSIVTDVNALTREPEGGLVTITPAKILIVDVTPTSGVGLWRWTYPTP